MEMKLKILGKHISTVDWPGRISYVLFFNSCGMGCWYCHNMNKPSKIIKHEKIVDDIRENMMLIDGVVFSGGEPLLHIDEILKIINGVNGEGLEWAVQTSGYGAQNFYKIKKYISQVFWDIKGDITDPSDWRARVVPKDAFSSMVLFANILRDSNIKKEFRFTIYKGYEFEKIITNIEYFYSVMDSPINIRLQRCICKDKQKEVSRKEIIALKNRISNIFGKEVVVNV